MSGMQHMHPNQSSTKTAPKNWQRMCCAIQPSPRQYPRETLNISMCVHLTSSTQNTVIKLFLAAVKRVMSLRAPHL